jgi:cytochrome P450
MATVNGISLSVVALLRNRSQWDLLVGHPELLTGAVEELLRYDNTIQPATIATRLAHRRRATVPLGARRSRDIENARTDAR